MVNNMDRQLYPWKEIRYPLYMILSGPHARSGRVRKSRPNRDLIPGPSKPVESRYTDYIIPALSTPSQREIQAAYGICNYIFCQVTSGLQHS